VLCVGISHAHNDIILLFIIIIANRYIIITREPLKLVAHVRNVNCIFLILSDFYLHPAAGVSAAWSPLRVSSTLSTASVSPVRDNHSVITNRVHGATARTHNTTHSVAAPAEDSFSLSVDIII